MKPFLSALLFIPFMSLGQRASAQNVDLSRLEKWRSDDRISGDSLYRLLTAWDYFPKVRTGTIYEYTLALDSNYKVPFQVYIPRDYDPRKKTALLLYYKGGWLSRKSLPADYRDEIKKDNPSFNYLDQYNMIEIFPALENKLAIYGNYGYQHLREMVATTKKLFNVDDDRVFLSGFSDGGKTVYLAANLVPSSFACFYPINGAIVSPPAYANYINRPIYSFVAEKDEITDYRSILTKAEYASTLGATWYYRELKDKKHFYFPYQDEVMPVLFSHLSHMSRNPFPVSITYHRTYDYKEFSGIDWLQMKVNTERAPSTSHFTDSVHTYTGSGEEMAINYGEKTGQLVARYFNNTFTITSSLVNEIEIYISPIMINMSQPVKVIINGKEIFSEKVGYSKSFMLERFIKYFDRQQLWVNKIELAVD